MDTLPKLANLTPDDRIWRLDWFGECGYPGSIRRYAQPSIRVVLSPLRCDPSDAVALTLPDCTDHQHSHETWAPISALPLLAIGNLWQDGRQIASPDYRMETFKKLAINVESACFVKAGLAINENFLLPLSRHPWHRSQTQSYCVTITLETGKRLLVPCVELIRFYFGSSGILLQRLFTAPLTANTLWTKKHFNPANRHLHLTLANRLSGVSAADIGRIAESKLAWRAAASIFASCQRASAQRLAAHAYTGFPFEGTTDLTVSGIWLPFGDAENETFIAYRLRSCSHPFPFLSLSYEAADRRKPHGTQGSQDGGKTKFAPSQAKMTETVSTDSGLNKNIRGAGFASRHRFPDLLRKQVWREKIETIQNADVFLRRSDGSLEQVAFGESDDTSHAAGVDARQKIADEAKSPVEDTLPQFVQYGLKAIEKDRRYTPQGATVKVLYPKGKNKLIFSLPMLVNEDGEIDMRLLCMRADGRTDPRRGCFAEILVNDDHHKYMMIVEGESSHEKPKTVVVNTVELRATYLAIAQSSIFE